MNLFLPYLFLIIFMNHIFCLVPPKYEWTTLNYNWPESDGEKALHNQSWIPENNVPLGLGRWADKLFITVPRWKKGVPSTLNYVVITNCKRKCKGKCKACGNELHPYPAWRDAMMSDTATSRPTTKTIISAFRIAVDRCDRLWVVDAGATDIFGTNNQIAPPSLAIFDLKSDKLLRRYEFDENHIKGPETFFTNIVVDLADDNCKKAFAYIPDMGGNTLLVYSFEDDDAWLVDHPYFHFDPHAGQFNVGGIDFYWSDGITGVTLTHPGRKAIPDLYFHPLSSTRLFKMSTKLLRKSHVKANDLLNGVEVVGNKGPRTQSNACVYDAKEKIIFYTELNRNGLGCWNTLRPFDENNTALIFSDCVLLEFPCDLKIDNDHNIWILSNKMSRFMYKSLDPTEVNFRVLTAPVKQLIKGTLCEAPKKTLFKHHQSNDPCKTHKCIH